MQHALESRIVQTVGGMSSGTFGMDDEDAAHIFAVLHGTLYSRKEYALLREYGSNAWDEHRQAGIPDVPIKVSLPTDLEPTLVIRDYGRGLSEEDIYKVYARYGKSTKRSDSNAVGFLGIGSKAAFAYTDTFTITSYHEQKKSIYVCVLGEDHVGRVNKLHEEPCGDETGVEIRVAVNPKDAATFQSEASDLFRFFKPTPIINIAIEPSEFDGRSNGFVRPASKRSRVVDSPLLWTAVVGVIPYRLDLSKMRPELVEAGLLELAQETEGGLYFGLDEGVSLGAHREEVAYTASTKKAIVDRLRLLFDEIVGDLDRAISDPEATPWQKRMAVRAFRRATHLSVPSKYLEWASTSVKIYSWNDQLLNKDGAVVRDEDGNVCYDVPVSFRMQGFPYKRVCWGAVQEHSTRLSERPDLEILPTTRLLIQDTKHPIRGYKPKVDDYIVTTTNGHTLAEVLEELPQWLDSAGVRGLPVLRLSDMPFHGKVRTARRPTAKACKDVEQHFVLRSCLDLNARGLSKHWDFRPHVPSEEDVFVVMSGYQIQSQPDFYSMVVRDRNYFRSLGGNFPTIVGYKQSAQKPVTPIGTPYHEWRKKALLSLTKAHPEVHAELVNYEWRAVFYDPTHRFNQNLVLKSLRDAGFTEEHPLVALFARWQQAEKVAKSVYLYTDFHTLYKDIGQTLGDAKERLDAAYARYPLISTAHYGPGFGVLTSSANQPWLAYIRSVDQENP